MEQSERLAVCGLRMGLAWTVASVLLLNSSVLFGQEQEHKIAKQESRLLTWSPPQVEWPLKSLIAAQPCVLPDVLHQAADRANALFDGLQSFTAQEDIQYEALDQLGNVLDQHVWSYNYLVLFNSSQSGLVVQDSRNDRNGSKKPANFNQDLGLTELALIFLPEMQSDYDFKCEGTTQWNGQPAWVVYFQQRKDKPHRTVFFRGEHADYPASIRGRAWIGKNSGEIQHMETSLMATISEVSMRHWYLSIDYAPVAFHSMKVSMVLPQTVDAYCETENHNRTIAYHAYTDFKLFSVNASPREDKPAAH